MKSHLTKLLEKLKNKKVAFLGIARTNIPVIKLLLDYKNRYNIEILALDSIKTKEDNFIKYLINNGIECRLGKDYIKKLDMDIIFRSPGIYYSSEDLKKAKDKNIEITSEMEEFFKICPCKTLAVTGSDGKTTTTTIISKILKEEGYNVYLGGNIGEPLLHKIESIKVTDIAVLELSSFQLISMKNSPDIAVLTNISPNHLDVHKDMDEYVKAKENILKYQNKDSLAVLNTDTEKNYKLRNKCKGKVLFFKNNDKKILIDKSLSSTSYKEIKFVQNGAIKENDNIYFIKDKIRDFIIKNEDIKLKGNHNTENILAAICATYNLVNKSSIVKVLSEFVGVPHRLEFVAEKEGVTYINDSIATTPTRTIKGALSLFSKKIILIAGGYDKNISFDLLGEKILEKVKLLILLGDTAKKIFIATKEAANNDSLGNYPEIIFTDNLESAVKTAKTFAANGDKVVLSPACASFDLYKDFQERGEHFKKLVKRL